VAAAIEEQAYVVGGFGVAFVGGEARDAGAEATVNVILQARARVGTSEIDGAGWNEKTFVDEVKNTAREAGGKVRPEIKRAVFYDAAGEIDTGIFFGCGEFDVGIGFVVPKHDVELRVVLLDEIVFEREGFAFVGDDDGFEVGDFAGE